MNKLKAQRLSEKDLAAIKDRVDIYYTSGYDYGVASDVLLLLRHVAYLSERLTYYASGECGDMGYQPGHTEDEGLYPPDSGPSTGLKVRSEKL